MNKLLLLGAYVVAISAAIATISYPEEKQPEQNKYSLNNIFKCESPILTRTCLDNLYIPKEKTKYKPEHSKIDLSQLVN